MELIKDYNYTIAYHPGKANVVANALSRKNPSTEIKGRIAFVKELRCCKEILNTGLAGNLIARFQVKPTLEEEIVRSQLGNPMLRKLVEDVKCEIWTIYAFRNDGVF